MSYYDYSDLEYFADFDDEYAYYYADDDVNEILYFGETDDGAHWTIADYDGRIRAYLHKPGYCMGEPESDYVDWCENPLLIEDCDNEYDAFEFISETVGYDW